MIAQQKTRNMLSLYLEKKEFVFFFCYISRETRDPECVRFFWIPQRGSRHLVLFVSTFTDLQAENERKQFP